MARKQAEEFTYITLPNGSVREVTLEEADRFAAFGTLDPTLEQLKAAADAAELLKKQQEEDAQK